MSDTLEKQTTEINISEDENNIETILFKEIKYEPSKKNIIKSTMLYYGNIIGIIGYSIAVLGFFI